MLIAEPRGLSTFDLKTREIKLVVPGFVYRVRGSSGVEIGRKTRHVYYEKDGAIWATHLDTLATRKLADLPPDTSMSAINADETLAVGTLYEGDKPTATVGWPAPGQSISAP